MTVPVTIAPTLGKLIPRLASDHDGEVVATARAIERVLKSAGRDWHDLAAVLTSQSTVASIDWRREARFCVQNSAHLTTRELRFIATLAQWRGNPTDKQLRWLQSIADRLRAAA